MSAKVRSISGIVLLLTASLLVAVAILTNGALSRGVNGLGGILWIVSAVMLWRSLRHDGRPLPVVVATFGLTVGLVLVIKPSDLLVAGVGFGIAGAVVGVAARSREIVWAAMIPALWLPLHLSLAITRAVLENGNDSAASVRTDPPPTAAFVPFVMVVAALAGGLIIRVMRRVRGPRCTADGGTSTAGATLSSSR